MVQALIAQISPDLAAALSSNDRDWMIDAACQDSTYDVFFPVSSKSHAYDEARRICATCPVKLACYDYIMANPDPFGMWAGMTPSERRYAERLHRRAPKSPKSPQ